MKMKARVTAVHCQICDSRRAGPRNPLQRRNESALGTYHLVIIGMVAAKMKIRQKIKERLDSSVLLDAVCCVMPTAFYHANLCAHLAVTMNENVTPL